MKPLSTHWADTTATRIIKERGDKSRYVVASGITPSGQVHVGNFREVITVDLVARGLRAVGKSVRFIYSWDNFDTFRKVPKNLPDPQGFEKYLRQPIARIPDPWGAAKSYAQGRISSFEAELKELGINPEFLYQESRYASGIYAKEVQCALQNRDKIRAILNQYRTSPLEESWLPSSVYCTKCQRDDIEGEHYDGAWGYQYRCKSCGNEETIDIRNTKNMKLAWRVDWPMRWAFEKVDFEPGGKDHSSRGGSFDTGQQIVKEVWGIDAPIYLQYDFVMIKGGTGKMSSSSGELFTLTDIMEIYTPQMIRWLFANQRPNHDFALAFDEDVIKLYDEFDKAEGIAFDAASREGKQHVIRRTYELSLPVEPKPNWDAAGCPKRPKFRELANRLQICGGDVERTHQRFYSDPNDAYDFALFAERAQRAWTWVCKYAPEDFRYALHQAPVEVVLSPEQAKALAALRELVSSVDLDAIDGKALNELIWEKTIRKAGCEAPEAFKAFYQKLIGRDRGPRLPSFLKEVGRDKLLELL